MEPISLTLAFSIAALSGSLVLVLLATWWILKR